MGLYDEDEPNQHENEGIGKVLANANKKPLKDKENKKLTKSSGFEFPSWLTKTLLWILCVVLVIIIGYAIFLSFKPDYLSAKLIPNPSYLVDGSSTTKLTVTVDNISDYDLKNIELSVSPVDKLSIVVIPSDPTKISILGIDEKRDFSFDISTIGNVSPGEYAILITLKTPEDISEKKIFWEIKNHK